MNYNDCDGDDTNHITGELSVSEWEAAGVHRMHIAEGNER